MGGQFLQNGTVITNHYASRRGRCFAGNSRVQKAQNTGGVEGDLQERRNQRARGKQGADGAETLQAIDGVCNYPPKSRQKGCRGRQSKGPAYTQNQQRPLPLIPRP